MSYRYATVVAYVHVSEDYWHCFFVLSSQTRDTGHIVRHVCKIVILCPLEYKYCTEYASKRTVRCFFEKYIVLYFNMCTCLCHLSKDERIALGLYDVRHNTTFTNSRWGLCSSWYGIVCCPTPTNIYTIFQDIKNTHCEDCRVLANASLRENWRKHHVKAGASLKGYKLQKGSNTLPYSSGAFYRCQWSGVRWSRVVRSWGGGGLQSGTSTIGNYEAQWQSKFSYSPGRAWKPISIA